MSRKKIQDIFVTRAGWLVLLVILVLINILAARFHTRLDLTKEKRYTLSPATIKLLNDLDDDVQIDVFLKGDFPAGFRKLANSTEEFLQLLKDRNGSKIHYRFISPLDEIEGTQTTYGDSLVNMGAVPINLTVRAKAGQTNNIIFPAAIIHHKGVSSLINLYPGASGRISQEEINSAEALMEYQFANALYKMSQPEKPAIAYTVGNGEPTDGRTYDLVQTVSKDYRFGILDLKTQADVPADVDVLLIVKPSLQFSEDDKFKIDQFVMRGGKLFCFIDNLNAEQDSLAFGKTQIVAFDRNLNLTDLFFRYGLRINTDLVMDLQCDMIPFVVGGTNENPQFEFLHWNYYPLFTPASQLNKNLGYVAGRFVNSIDTIKVDNVKKTPLLVSSANSRIISTPALISLNENKNVPEHENFKRNEIPVAMLLEGNFTSLFRNRVGKMQMDSLSARGAKFMESANDNKIIVVADGDMVFNEILPGTGPLPMGWNKYTYSETVKQTEFGKYFVPAANRQFFQNCLEYLVNDPAISQTRNKDIVLRLLDSEKLQKGRSTWQFLNIALPVLLVILFGWIYQQVRKRKYAS